MGDKLAIAPLLHTARLTLRAWTPADAEALAPVLAENEKRLMQWIPAHVASAAPVAELRERLSGYAADFAAERAFRYGVFRTENSTPGAEAWTLLGGADLHPRTQHGRVPAAEADGVEIGYWLAKSAEGFGYAVEAAQALLTVAKSVDRFRYAEARVDSRNARSAAVAQRLGLGHARSEGGLDIWQLSLLDPNMEKP